LGLDVTDIMISWRRENYRRRIKGKVRD
jgi:hypothetical protein